MLDVSERGGVKQHYDDLDEMPETCSLDVADRDGMKLVDIAKLLRVTRERVRQIEQRALRRLKHARSARSVL